MPRSGAGWLIALAFLAALPAEIGALESAGPAPTHRRLAATADAAHPECPRAALYIIAALPNVKDAAVFQLVRNTYISTVKGLAPAGAISEVIPWSTEPNRIKGGVSAHTIILFSGSCEAGKAAARTLHVKLLGDVRTLFYVPAPRAKSLFGDVYMITVSHPYLADGYGKELSAPAAPAGTNLAAQFSITWEDVPPSMIGEQQAAAFKAAILKQLPAGAGVYFTTMITQGVSYRYGNHWRACAAPVSPTAAKSAGKTSQGGAVWPPGQPADIKSGRLVFNANIHGTVFNTAAGKQTLAQFLDRLRINTASVFPRTTFGRMVLEGGSGLRLVNDPAYPCACETAPPPELTSAQAFGPNSATATATGASNVTWARWRFSATPTSGPALVQEAASPLVWWYNLAADTTYTIRAVGITLSGEAVPSRNSVTIRTPLSGAPTLASADPSSPDTAVVRIAPPTNTQANAVYTISICRKTAPTNCVRRSSPYIQITVPGLVPGASYVVSATAKVNNKPVPSSNSLPLVMPARGAPTLLTAGASSARTGAATAAAPNGVAFSQFIFTAKPLGGGSSITSKVSNPRNGQFRGLKPSTQYDVTVVGVRNGVSSPPSNSLSFVTPAANAPLNTGVAKNPTTVIVKLFPPTLPPLNGGSWVKFDVTLCPIAGPQSACVTQRTSGTSGRRLLEQPAGIAQFTGRDPFSTYNFVSIAISNTDESSKQAMTGQVTTPGAIPWSLDPLSASTTQTTVTVKINPPSEGGPYDSFLLSVCLKAKNGGTPDWDTCPTTTCLPSQVSGCLVSGLAANTNYTVSAVAISGETSSVRSNAADFTTLPWPAPTVSIAPDLTSAAVSVVAPTAAPPNGWQKYVLRVCPINRAGTCFERDCTPVKTPPAATTCQLADLDEGTKYSLRVTAVQGSYAAPAPLKYFTTATQDGPTILSVKGTSSVSGVACLEPPTQGGRLWTKYSCAACYGGSCVTAPTCTIDPTRRRSLLAQACTSGQACNLPNLEASTPYTVSCKALTATNTPSPVTNSTDTLDTWQAGPPVVTMSTSNPVIAECGAPAGGPFASCSLLLCPVANKRRSLLDGGCVTTSCPFNGATAACNLAGVVEQGIPYSVNATAVKADGVRKSQSTGAPLPTISIPLFPKPTVWAKSTGALTWNVSVTPNTTIPLFSYPETGWVYYSILVQQGGSSKTVKCTAGVKNGVPTKTVCPITLTSATLPTFTVMAVKGSSSNPLPTDLRSAASDSFTPQDGPTILSVSSYSPNSGTVCLEPPTQGGPAWTKYSCAACYGGSCVTAPTCTIDPTRRRSLLGGGCVTGDTCNLPNLEAGTPYTVSCKARMANNTASPTTNSSTPLTTKTASPPILQMDPTNPVVLQCITPSGGPWSVCTVQFCEIDKRRRSLLNSVQCDSLSCPVNPTTGIASCNLTHFLPQELTVTGNGTAVKADGTRKSQSTPAPLPTFSIPLFPKPSISVVIVGEQTYNLTMTPNVTTPLISFPAGGWTIWAIQATNGSVGNGTYCTALQQNGVPKVTTCTVTLPFTGAVPTFFAAGYQGTLGTNLNLELHTAFSDPFIPQDGPTIVTAVDLGYDLGAACVSNPTQGGPWTGVNCTACAGASCFTQQCAPGGGGRRRLQSFDCGSSLFQCNWECLQYDTNYKVKCVAFNTGGTLSPASVTNSTFTTDRPPSPIVEPNGKNSTTLRCTAPPVGGVWQWCNLTLCAQAKRRRELLSTGCPGGAITTSCPFDGSGQAVCVMGGVVQQNKVYSVKSIAVTTNGYTSDEGEWSPFQIFTFPKPSVSVLKTSNTTFDVTVAPVVVTPGVSFPSPTVWTYYRINMTIGGVSTLINCTAVVVSGIPQPTVCPVTVAAGALPNFVATCYTGNPSSPKNTDLYSYNSDDTPAPGPPTIVSTGSTTADSGTLCIAAPTSGGTYSGFNCTICRLGSCTQAPTCPNSRRRSLLEAGCTGAAECQLTGLESSTEYNITCIAINSVGVASPTSSEQLLTVMQADAPAVAAKASNPLVAQCTAPIGGPWASCRLLICPPLARRRLLAASCFNATCPFNATTGIAECDLIGQVAQLKSYAINSTAVKADGVRASKTGVQPQFYVGLYPKPVVTNALAINQTYFTMTITPDTSNPFVSYPPGGWTHWYLNATTTYPSTALYWCSANVSNGVPQPTSCQFTVPFGAGGMTKFVVWGFQGSDPSAALATDLITASVKLFYPQDGPNITSLTATSYNSSQACMAPPLRGTFSAYNCTACTGGTCLPTVSCGGSQGTCDAGKIQCLLDGMAQDTEYSVSCLAWSGSSVSPNSNTVTVTTDKAPPPPVAADPTNPLVAQCTEPPGGPWSTCSLQICPAGGRRRLLGGTISCFSTTCPFNSGIANCDLIGQVAQDTNFAISSTAIKADGVKTSQTGPQPTFNVPYYPKPIVTDAQMLGDMDFRMTIYPETGSPYVSYPPGGWTHYIVYCDFNAAISSGYCTANVSSGVPQVTDCSIYCNSGGGAFTMLSVVGYRGDPTATTLTDLRTFASDPFLSQDPPYIISTPSISTTSGTACVMQPYNNAPFSSFNCTACSGGTCEAPVSCNAARRRSLLSAGRSLLSTGCGTDETACAMTNLQPGTNYNVTCVGIKTGLITPASAVASFTTQTSG